jgi:uncharacterized protein YigE (DUF2233 family)
MTARMLTILILAIAASAAIALLVWRFAGAGSRTGPTPQSGPPVAALPGNICRETAFEGARYIACTADPAHHTIGMFLKRADGKAYGSVKAFAAASGKSTLIAMNAGMYHDDLTPVGLHIEHGKILSRLNTADAEGNFFLKPNGVFGVQPDGEPFVVTTEAFALAKRPVAHATQSGPMLVVGGQIHPKFLPDGESRHIRNGVGVTADGKAIFAISRDPVSLGKFARFFRDSAQCPDALFFDGAVSSLAIGGNMVVESGFPAGPIVAVFPREAAPGF